MLYTIYQVTHRESGKYYIGKHQTNDLNDGYMGSGQLIRAAIKKYGHEAFDKEVLCVFTTEEEMNAKEAELVTEEFCSRKDTYNLCVGGQGGWSYVNSSGLNNLGKDYVSVSEKMKGNKHLSLWNKDRHSKGQIRYDNFSGRSHSDETREKMSKSRIGKQTGRANSQFGSFWITDGSSNKKIRSDQDIPQGWYKGRTVHSLVRTGGS